ncbi:MAG: adenylosuccinate lyase, partial [Reyranella sp.]|nr:adenylosuccinate lyase [Reyranella sp.]
MIPRYSRPQMAAIWTPENRFRIWFEVEAHACDAMAELGIIPKAAAKAIWDGGAKAMAALKASPAAEVEKIDAIERVTKHDVLAFTTWLADYVGPDSRFVHQGLTSSDVLDTTFAVQLTQASDLLLEGIDKVLAALKKRALEHKHTPTIGRSHGIHAEPTTFGIKLAGHYAAFARNRRRLETARAEIATCAMSGPVGTFASVDPRIEEYVAKKLGFAPEPVSTQVIPRDRHAAFFATLGVIASSIENLATEIRHLQRTEVREAEEFFSVGQKGSSSMPHKRNPVLTENLTGLARVVRSAVVPALENVTLWHERDISHSSTERYIAPDATGTLDFALNRLAGVVENLVVYADRMKANLESLGGIVFSQRVLLALTQKGMSREASYAAVQRNAMEAWRGNASLLALVRADKEIRQFLADDELVALFEPGWHTRHVDVTFRRVF